MPLSWNEIRQRAITFSREWADAIKENAEAQTFWNEFFHVLGKRRQTVATFEESVKSITGSAHRIDLFWSGRLIGEHKSRGSDLTKAHLQANGTTQSIISDLEDAEYQGHSMSMLRRIATALGLSVCVEFVDTAA